MRSFAIGFALVLITACGSSSGSDASSGSASAGSGGATATSGGPGAGSGGAATTGSGGNATTGSGGNASAGSGGNGSGGGATTSSGAGGAPADCAGVDATFTAVLSKPLSGCSGLEPPCHNKGAGYFFFDPADPDAAWNAMVNVDAATPGAGKRVLPGDAKHSFLYRKLTDDLGPDEGDPMPKPPNLPGATWKELPQDQLDMVRCWILEGAQKN